MKDQDPEAEDHYFDDRDEVFDEPVCPRCQGDGMDPRTDYLLPCPDCMGETNAMTNTPLITALTAWKMQIDQSNEMVDNLIEPLMLSPESPLYSTIWALQGALTKAVAKNVGDEFDWLDWFHAENQMGKCAMEACPGTGKPTRKIKDLADLAWLIEESR